MLIQIALGTGLMFVTILISGLAFWGLEVWLVQSRAWLMRPPHRAKLLLILGIMALWIMAQLTVAVWVWAMAFVWLDLFHALEPSVYFALVSFTTLGFGDVLLPQDWRLLGGLAAANGLMHFGLMTAMMVEGFRQVRLTQLGHVHHPS